MEFDWRRHAISPINTPLGTPRGTPVGTPRGGNSNREFKRGLKCNEPESDEKFEFILKMIKNDQTLSEEGTEKISCIKRKLYGNDYNPDE